MNSYGQLRRVILPLLAFSLITNLSVLVSPLFMMQVLDRVVPSGNISTLFLLGALAVGALALQGFVETARDNCLGRLSRWTERQGTAMAIAPGQEAPQKIVDQVAEFARFLGGPSALATLNIPWVPLFLLALLLVHPAFLLLLAVMLAVSMTSKHIASLFSHADEMSAAQLLQTERDILNSAEKLSLQTEVKQAARNLRGRFAQVQSQRHGHLDAGQVAIAASTSVANFVRSSGQILALGLGAYLVTIGQLSAGGMIAASIILSKCYGNIESTVGQIDAIRNAVLQFNALSSLPEHPEPTATEIQDLSGELRAEGLIFPKGGGAPPRLDRVTFSLQAGECLVVLGSSGSGKTTLLKALAGIDPAPIGSVFLDESEIRGLTEADLYRLTGYLPQNAALVHGSIAENISGFSSDASDERVIEAAKSAGVHGLISALPQSYDTDLKRDLHLLSNGQQQRVALARAIYNRPKYLFLDEPNALLDADGERALNQTLFRLKEGGTTMVLILHRSGLMGLADKVARLDAGRVIDFGSRNDVLGRLGLGGRTIELPVLESSIQDLCDWISSQFTRSTDEDFSHKAQCVATELLKLACHHEPKEPSRAVQFSFTFVDDTHCELTMAEGLSCQAEATMTRVRAKLSKNDVFLTDLPDEEAALATVERLSERFEVRCLEDETRYCVALTGGVKRAHSSLSGSVN